MRIILAGLLISASLVSACTSENDRVYAEAKRCAALITNGGDCPPRQEQNTGKEQSNQAGNPGQPASPPKNERSMNSSNEESRVYIDASESMKGFAFAPDNTFVKVIEALSYAMPGCRLYKYGIAKGKKDISPDEQSSFASEIRFSQELRKPSFYDLNFNEDDVLINHLATEEPSARSVLLTDGVYSARNTELQSELVKAIGQWLHKGGFFGILIFTSPFDGKLYSENMRAWTEKVNVSARPFYAFVFSPTEKGFREVKDRLSGDDVKVLSSLVFPPSAISCVVNPVDKNGLEKKDVPPGSPFYLHVYGGSIFDAKNQAELFYDLRCTPASDYPATKFKVEVTLNAYSWQQEYFKRNEQSQQFDYKYTDAEPTKDAAPPASEASLSPASSPTPVARRQPNLRLTLNKDLGSSYSLYHLLFNLSSEALKPGIRDLSTQDDSLPGEAGKTYRFYEFISALTAMHLKNKEVIKLPPPVFVTLKNK